MHAVLTWMGSTCQHSSYGQSSLSGAGDTGSPCRATTGALRDKGGSTTGVSHSEPATPPRAVEMPASTVRP
ncbi:MAG: hypothetical protein GXX79_10735 [Actinomycetales bacterium]|nr:hypothetical protein [Actinomycetales bacterium]